ncbi:MAG: DUF2262 domain-containing protein, partial [Candidatus Accumulibacter sp.]|nr:DUF2262 domain-containing protein [Accumulibacter sp.]
MNTRELVKAFESAYREEEKELLVLFSDASGGAAKDGDEVLWTAQAFFLACVDAGANELKKGDGRIVWPMTDKEAKHPDHWHRFKKGGIYRLRVREPIEKTALNHFLLVETLEEEVRNDDLLAILAEYRKPVKITDETLGEFELDKNLDLFNGEIDWLGEKIHVSLDVDSGNKATWTKAMKVLRALSERQARQDAEFRAFAAERLTGLANDWSQEEDATPITEQDFADRIR